MDGMTDTQQRAFDRFDALPEASLVDVVVVAALCGVSVQTAWRMARKGALPAPVRLTAGTTRWGVGAIRKFLAAGSGAAPSARGRRGAGGVFTAAA